MRTLAFAALITASLHGVALAQPEHTPSPGLRGEGRGEGPAATADLHSQLREAVRLLADEDAPAAAAIVEPLLASKPYVPTVKAVAGMVRVHQQRYAEAVKLFDEAGAAASGLEHVALARAALEITKGHVRVDGEHFTVSVPKGKDEVLAPWLLDALERQRAALAADLGGVPAERVVVEVLNGTKELSRLSTLTEDEIKTSGTIAICKFGKLMIVSPKALVHGYDWLDTAAHEYVHYVLVRRTENKLPVWLHEGFARWAETRWRGAGGEALDPYSAALLRDAVKRNDTIPFAAMHPSIAKLPSQEAAALAFAQAMVAVEYLHAEGGQRALNAVLEGVTQGRSGEAAVAAAAGGTFAAFDAAWKRHALQRPLPPGGEHVLKRLRFKGDPAHGGAVSDLDDVPDPRAKEWARLGEILRARGRMAAARLEYEKAVERVGAASPALAAKYGLAAIATGKAEQAEPIVREAAASHPSNALLQVTLGKLHLARGEWAKGEEAFLLALRVDPFDPEIHAGLALALEKRGDASGASRAKRFAEMLSTKG